ncbi:MAG TPA: iron-containing alcohol dehydrogenase [Sphingobium sp.]
MEIPKSMLDGAFTNLPLDDVYFGPGSISKLADALDARNVKRAVVVTGHSIASNAELIGKLEAALGPRLAGIYSETHAHVPRSSVLAVAEFARSKGADGLVSFGGGSPNDTMKAIGWALAEDVQDEDEFDKFSTKFEYPDKLEIPALTKQPLPTFAIPTTLSAGEFTAFFGITDEKRKVKDVFHDSKLTAKAVILDPELTLATPEWLWLSTGIRAVDHCVEQLLSSKAQPYTDALASHALNMLYRYLKDCKKDPHDLAARGQCQVAAWLSFFSVANVTLGLSHGIGHQLGARCNVPHGVTSCIMMHNVMEYNREVTLERQAWIADILGVELQGDVLGSAIAAKEAILGLIRDDLGLPWRLRDVNVTEADFELIARDAMQDLIVATNPRKVSSEADVVALLAQAY